MINNQNTIYSFTKHMGVIMILGTKRVLSESFKNNELPNHVDMVKWDWSFKIFLIQFFIPINKIFKNYD